MTCVGGLAASKTVRTPRARMRPVRDAARRIGRLPGRAADRRFPELPAGLVLRGVNALPEAVRRIV